MTKLDGLSLFFPCHNEEANVEGVIVDALRIAPQVASRYEVIIVDDGSTDPTPAIAQGFKDRGNPVRLVRHSARRGYGEALKSGFRAAHYAWVFYSDGDRQFDLDELPRLLEKTKEADIVSGYRARRADPWHRSVNSQVFRLALRWLIGLDFPDVNCAFKLYRRDLFDRLQLKSSGALINAEIFAKARQLAYTLAWVEVSHRPRMAGRQSGAQLSVIGKAVVEFASLWWEVNHEN